jgi:hypothetical protein
MARHGERQPLLKTVLLGKKRYDHVTWTVSDGLTRLWNG